MRVHCSCTSDGTQHANLLIIKGHFKVCLGLIGPILQRLLFGALIHPLRWSQASSVKNICFRSEHRHVLTAETSYKSASARKLPSSVIWTFVISSADASHVVVFETWACGLIVPGTCSPNVQNSSSFSWVRTHCICCFAYLRKINWTQFFHQFKNHWRSSNSNTRLLTAKLSFTLLTGLIFTKLSHRKFRRSSVYFAISIYYYERQHRLVDDLTRAQTQTEQLLARSCRDRLCAELCVAYERSAAANKI